MNDISRVKETEYPDFEPEYSYDQRQRPSEVTIFCDDPGRISTEWITAPIEMALPVEEVR